MCIYILYTCHQLHCYSRIETIQSTIIITIIYIVIGGVYDLIRRPRLTSECVGIIIYINSI
jgi:hypothetical protein